MTDSSPRLEGKTAVVTGGASGIGRAIANAFATHGAKVHIVDVNEAAAQAAAGEISSDLAATDTDEPVQGDARRAPSAHSADVADPAAVTRVFDRILSEGSVDILVNNAGIAHIGNVAQTTPADMDRLYAVNIKGVYNCTQAVIGAMKAAGNGVILNMASIAGSVGIADRFAYSMTKGAVLAMTYSVAKDYATDGIRCVSISPARIHTPFVDGYLREHYPGRESEMFETLSATQPIGRMGMPHEVADLAVYLCSDEAGFATGTDYPLDGGFMRLHG